MSMNWKRFLIPLAGLSVTGAAVADDVTVTITNLSPDLGTFLTPVWVGFHDGSFDLYDSGVAASADLERLAEDGDTSFLSSAFQSSGAGTTDATIISTGSIPPFAPGDNGSMMFTLDGLNAQNRYFSYASMIIPSNDAFIANGNPMSIEVFDDMGNFVGADFIVVGSQVLDAGTEVNDEIPENTAFFGQTVPDTGVVEGGVVHAHPGFLPPGSGGILDDPAFVNADFLADGYQVARITIVPEPAAGLLLILGALSLRRR